MCLKFPYLPPNREPWYRFSNIIIIKCVYAHRQISNTTNIRSK